MEKPDSAEAQRASRLIDKKIAGLGDWRGKTLAKMRALINEAVPDVIEEWKWMGTPVFSHDGIICTGETHTAKVKLTFAKGALLEDPAKLFNAGLEGNARRAIDILEGGEVDADEFKALVQRAADFNSARKKKPVKKAPA
jgi:hypothetical protein